MEKRIEDIINLYFEDIPYSEEVKKAQDDIKTALDRESMSFR